MSKLTLDTDNQVFFYEQDFYVLSNFSAFQVELDGVDFQTAEHAYHFLKFRFTAKTIADEIRFARSAHDAFKFAQQHKDKQVKNWNAVRLNEMRRIIKAKARQHEYVRRKLLDTGDRMLVENSWRDDFWGWGPNRDGKNWLGRLWEEYRSELREGEQQP